MNYVQCTMESPGQDDIFNDGKEYITQQVAWIPAKFAQKGRVIYFGKKPTNLIVYGLWFQPEVCKAKSVSTPTREITKPNGKHRTSEMKKFKCFVNSSVFLGKAIVLNALEAGFDAPKRWMKFASGKPF